MARSARLFQRAPAVTRGIVVTLALSTQAAAQSASPCRPGDSLLSLGKAAFFRSIERGAFAIGERTLDDLTDGLGTNTAARTAARPKRAGATPPARVRAATFPPTADAALAGALKAYVDSPSSDAADAAFQAVLEAATKILFETLPAPGEASHVGLVLEGGQFFNRSSTFAVQDMTNESKRQSLEFSVFGDGPDLEMGKANPMLSQAPFFKAPVIADGHNLDRNNLGIEVNAEPDLRALWFDDYRAFLATTDPGRSAAQITEALNAGWPILQKFWALKRTGIFIDRALMTFGAEMRQVNRRVTEESLPTGVCDPQGR
jgi:hypothetical protein